MAKEGKKRSRKKIAFLLVGAILLLIGAGATFFRLKNYSEFENFVKGIESYSQTETDLMLAVNNLNQDYLDEIEALAFDPKADVAKNRKHLANARKIHSDYYRIGTGEYFPLLEEKAAEVKQFLARYNRLWLWGNEPKFLNLVGSVTDSAKEAKESFSEIIERQDLFAKIYLDLLADYVEYFYFLKDISNEAIWSARLKPFKKYTQGYKFEGEDQLKALYPQVYGTIKNYKTLFAKVYEMCHAYLRGDYSTASRLNIELQAVAKRDFAVDIDWDPLYRPFYQAELDAHLSGLSAINLYKEKKLGKVVVGTRRVAAWSLVWGSHLYFLDHKEKYPQAESVSDLVNVLVEGEYLPSDFQFDQETFSCSFKEGKYQLSFTDEVTGEEITISSID